MVWRGGGSFDCVVLYLQVGNLLENYSLGIEKIAFTLILLYKSVNKVTSAARNHVE